MILFKEVVGGGYLLNAAMEYKNRDLVTFLLDFPVRPPTRWDAESSHFLSSLFATKMSACMIKNLYCYIEHLKLEFPGKSFYDFPDTPTMSFLLTISSVKPIPIMKEVKVPRVEFFKNYDPHIFAPENIWIQKVFFKN